MTRLNPASRLRRIPGLTVHLASNEVVTVELPNGSSVPCGVHGLAVLDVFARELTFEEGIDRLRPRVRGAEDVMQLMDAVRVMHESGILVDEQPSGTTSPRFDLRGYASPPVHVAMLNDRDRTDRFCEAIAEVVGPGDIVVDIGTGTGILAVAAVRAGAKRVFAVEASGIGEVAREVFDANGVADRVTLVEGWSTQIDLPERADVLVSEMIGNEPLDERVLEITLDAKKRLLKPDARLIPSTIRIDAHLISLPNDDLARFTVGERSLDRWRGWYDIDLGPLMRMLGPRPYVDHVSFRQVRRWDRLAAPIAVADIDLVEVQDHQIEAVSMATASKAGSIHGVALSFELGLGKAGRLNIDPWLGRPTHWRIPIWWLPKPVRVSAGQAVRVTYAYRAPGTPDGVSLEVLT